MVNDSIEELMDLGMEPESLWWTRALTKMRLRQHFDWVAEENLGPTLR